VQQSFRFRRRSEARIQAFKRSILLSTLVTAIALVASSPRGRYLTVSLIESSRRLAERALGDGPSRSEIEAGWARYRRQSIAEAEQSFRSGFDELDPAVRRLMKYAGNDPETGVLRWGNFDRILLLPSTIFEPDDHGRSYRLRPNTRAVWLRNITVGKIPVTFFLVPDGPGMHEAARGTRAALVAGSLQTTNSWGLRGPEPDVSAPLRGIILGDSFMQGLFIADDETPPERLRRDLEEHLGRRVSVLNTGHLGYSPEQEYFTLIEYAERFAPRFVVLSLFANDFGDVWAAAGGQAAWRESGYWIGRITRYCDEHGLLLLTVPAPLESQLAARRQAGRYQGRITRLLATPSLHYFDPIEDFVNVNLKLIHEAADEGRRPATSPLFNGVISDGHFSAIGARVWAEAVSERLRLLMKDEEVTSPRDSKSTRDRENAGDETRES
jgi:hypothetical protein